MAEIETKRHVAATTGQEQNLPEPIQRKVGVEVSHIPNFQQAVSNYADATNWMSALGSKVAQSASTAIATKLGGELGKNPQGELPPPITEFDKTMRQSYEAQAQNTLGIEAQKLITNSNLELAAQPRLDSGTISKAQKSTLLGLQKILSLAPDEVRSKMEYQYTSIMINQNEQLVKRMMGEQKEDRIDKLNVSSKQNAENVYTLNKNGHDLDKEGDSKSALSIMNSEIAKVKAAAAVHDIKQSEAEIRIDAIKESYYSGKYARLASEADRNKKLQDFTRGLVTNPPKDIPEKYRDGVYRNVLSSIQLEQSLKAQSEELEAQLMRNRIIANPNAISDTDWLTFESKVSPNIAAKVKSTLLQTLKSNERKEADLSNLMINWGDSETLAHADSKAINNAFDRKVKNLVDNSQGGISHDDAEVSVAVNAGAPVPVFIKSLNDKATSGNPISIVSAAQQIKSIRDQEGGHALIGLSKTAEAIITQFQHQRGSMPDSDLARKITDNLLNIDTSLQSTLDNAWNLKLSQKGAGGLGASQSLAQFALRAVGVTRAFSGHNLGGKYFETIFGNDIYDQLRSNFDATRGDYDAAVEMTQNYVNQNYGNTYINGEAQFMDRPIERELGYKDHDVVPFIQQDLLNQMNEKFIKNKDENDYWEIKPVDVNGVKRSLATPWVRDYPAAEVIRHMKIGKETKSFRYPVNLVGRPGKEWSIVLNTPSGPRSIFLISPALGINIYKPNEDSIRQNHEKYMNQKGWF